MENKNLFNYNNIEIKQKGDTKTIRRVSIKNGTGYKSVTKYKNGKKIKSVKKPINTKHLRMIHGGSFVKGLFKDCNNCNKTRKK